MISGDVVADRLAPWRTPTQLTIYSTGVLDEDRTEVVTASGPDDGNVELIVPDDSSVFAGNDDPPVAHQAQVLLAH